MPSKKRCAPRWPPTGSTASSTGSNRSSLRCAGWSAVKLPSDVLRAAIERYEALDHDAGYAALCAALDETSRRVRGQFIEVDQQLKRDFLLLGGLRAGIGRILGRVPEYCSLNGQ